MIAASVPRQWLASGPPAKWLAACEACEAQDCRPTKLTSIEAQGYPESATSIVGAAAATAPTTSAEKKTKKPWHFGKLLQVALVATARKPHFLSRSVVSLQQ